MNLFKHRGKRILKDAGWLHPLSDPPSGKPLCREEYLEAMALLVSEVFTTGRARNLFIYGGPGTGKTLCVQYLLGEIRGHAVDENVPPAAVYVNAGRTRTPYYTMLEITKGLGLDVPDRGWQMFRLKQAFEAARKNRAVVIVIDEVDAIIFKEKEPLVYYLNRQPNTTLILVSNKMEDITNLPGRALSTLQPKLLGLKPYTPEETETILRERVRKALRPGAVSKKLLGVVAEAASKAGDIRIGFAILLSASIHAEKTGKTRVETEDVESAIRSETRIRLLKELEKGKKKVEATLKRSG